MMVLASLAREEIYRLFARTAIMCLVTGGVAALVFLEIGEENDGYDYLIAPVLIFGSYFSFMLLKAAFIALRRGAPLAFIEGERLYVLQSHYRKLNVSGLTLKGDPERNHFTIVDEQGHEVGQIDGSRSRDTFGQIAKALSDRMPLNVTA